MSCLSCPLCHAPLERLDGPARVLGCAQGHRFDVARQGHANLLGPVRVPPEAGDSRAMLEARRAFLTTGAYDFLADELARRALAALAARGGGVLVDIGCGEGHYLGRILHHADALERERSQLFGTDIAKDAARLAAGAHKGARFFVADTTRRLPFLDGAVDVALSVFAARHPAELTRVMAPGGTLLCALPQAHHLAALAEHVPLVGIHPGKVDALTRSLAETFRVVDEQALEATLSLGSADLAALVAMTPSGRHVSPADLERLRGVAPLEVQAAFFVVELVRR